jgi:hypothetical protein
MPVKLSRPGNHTYDGLHAAAVKGDRTDAGMLLDHLVEEGHPLADHLVAAFNADAPVHRRPGKPILRHGAPFEPHVVESFAGNHAPHVRLPGATGSLYVPVKMTKREVDDHFASSNRPRMVGGFHSKIEGGGRGRPESGNDNQATPFERVWNGTRHPSFSDLNHLLRGYVEAALWADSPEEEMDLPAAWEDHIAGHDRSDKKVAKEVEAHFGHAEPKLFDYLEDVRGRHTGEWKYPESEHPLLKHLEGGHDSTRTPREMATYRFSTRDALTPSDIHPEAQAKMLRNVLSFYKAHRHRLAGYGDLQRVGHNLWLDQQGRGAGFRDHDDEYGDDTDAFHETAAEQPEFYPHLDNDGKVRMARYQAPSGGAVVNNGYATGGQFLAAPRASVRSVMRRIRAMKRPVRLSRSGVFKGGWVTPEGAYHENERESGHMDEARRHFPHAPDSPYSAAFQAGWGHVGDVGDELHLHTTEPASEEQVRAVRAIAKQRAFGSLFATHRGGTTRPVRLSRERSYASLEPAAARTPQARDLRAYVRGWVNGIVSVSPHMVPFRAIHPQSIRAVTARAIRHWKAGDLVVDDPEAMGHFRGSRSRLRFSPPEPHSHLYVDRSPRARPNPEHDPDEIPF